MSCTQTRCFTDGAQVLLHEPLFDTVFVKIMATLQCSKIFSIIIFFLHHIRERERERENYTYGIWEKRICRHGISSRRKARTRHILQGSISAWLSFGLLSTYFRCFKRLIMASSFRPVHTFPMRSSRANNSWKKLNQKHNFKGKTEKIWNGKKKRNLRSQISPHKTCYLHPIAYHGVGHVYQPSQQTQSDQVT